MKIPSWQNLPESLQNSIEADAGNICPTPDLIFKAFQETNLNDVKVVILGQDPYPTPGKARGVAFGYHPEYTGPIDSSLFNIIREVKRDTGSFAQRERYYAPQSLVSNGNINLTDIEVETEDDVTLESWTKQGVLLLNTRLTVKKGQPMSHAGIGWEKVVTDFIQELDKTTQDKVYLLWGKEAQKYQKFINTAENYVLTTSHPCRFSVHRGFEGCGHFSATNRYLEAAGRGSIEW